MFDIVFKKSKTKYSIENIPFQEKLSDKEIACIKLLWSYSQKIYTKDALTQIENLLKNFLKNYSNLDFENLSINSEQSVLANYSINTSLDKETIFKFRQLCKEKQKISFTYENRYLNQKQVFTVAPSEIIITPIGCILKAYNPEMAEIQNFYTEDISNIKQLPNLSKPTNVKNSVTFALKGRLANAYELKNGERITNIEEDYIVVTNTEEDKDELLRRLLRYGKACEILYPKSFRKKALSLIAKIKANYE